MYIRRSARFKRTKVLLFCRKTKWRPHEIAHYIVILLYIPSFLRTFAAVFVESGYVLIPF